MSKTTKLVLDILMGAVVPVLILNNANPLLGTIATYILAALVPVAWVLFDLFFLTRRFNAITAYTGVLAVVGGLLAFWFVDGVLFALKDTAGNIFSILIFGISLLAGKPLIQYFVLQAIDPDTPARVAAIERLVAEKRVRRAFAAGTLLIIAIYLALAVANFLLNLNIVVAPFGSEAFNQQVAQVNTITRVAFPIPGFVAIGGAIWLAYRAIYITLPTEEGKSPLESDFWHLVDMYVAR